MNAPETLEAPADATALAIRKSLDQVEGALSEFDKISAGLSALEKAHPKNLACDVSTPKGMKEAVAGRAAWRDPRIAVEKARKAAKAPVLALGRDIDARASYITDRLIEGESNYDDQIKAEEARKQAERDRLAAEEQRRVSDLLARITELSGAVAAAAYCTAAQIEEHIQDLVKVPVDATFQEFEQQASEAKAATLAKLRDMHGAAVQREAEAARIAAERAELERLRAEQAERDRAERERIAAEQRAEAQRLAEQRRQIEADNAAAAAERRRADEEAARQRAEADRIAREEREAEQRELDKKLAALRREQHEAAEAARRQEEDRRAAEVQMRDAAQQMLDALLQWQAADEIADTKKQRAALAEARAARDIAIAAARA